MQQVHFPAVSAGLALAIVLSSVDFGSAAPIQLDCSLSDTVAQPENRQIVIIVDPDAKALTAKDRNQSYRFGDVSISNVSISGEAGNISVGIDRSSLGIVWQQYDGGKTATQFGNCQQQSPVAAKVGH
jgi:hypothetical protein